MADETTHLDPLQEVLFQKWLLDNANVPGVRGWDQPDTHYDIRGFFNDKEALGRWSPGDHGPDTYKQHGHPTFSTESKYRQHPNDGGHWGGEQYLPQLATSRYPGMSPDQIESSLIELLRNREQ